MWYFFFTWVPQHPSFIICWIKSFIPFELLLSFHLEFWVKIDHLTTKYTFRPILKLIFNIVFSFPLNYWSVWTWNLGSKMTNLTTKIYFFLSLFKFIFNMMFFTSHKCPNILSQKFNLTIEILIKKWYRSYLRLKNEIFIF